MRWNKFNNLHNKIVPLLELIGTKFRVRVAIKNVAHFRVLSEAEHAKVSNTLNLSKPTKFFDLSFIELKQSSKGH